MKPTFEMLALGLVPRVVQTKRSDFRRRIPRWSRSLGLKTAGVAALAFVAVVSAASAGQIGGRYSVAGSNLDGSRYSGTVDLTVSSNTACSIVWHTGGDDLTGICMRSADTLVAAYVADGAVGLVLYKIEDNGTLDGVWTAANQNRVGTDVLTPQTLEAASPVESAPPGAPGGGHGDHHGP